MKLKKFAAMMLAGVMAVSMLAGCNGKSNTNNGGNDGEGNTVTPTSIVAAVNNGQSKTNKVKIDFTSDATLDAALAKAVKAVGDNPNSLIPLNMEIARLTGISINMTEYMYGGNTNDVSVYATVPVSHDDYNQSAEKTGEFDGAVVEAMWAVPLMNAATEKAAAEKLAAAAIDAVVAGLDDTTLDSDTKNDQKYYDFSYTGKVSMVSSTANDGSVNYYYAFVITQTATQKTLEA